MKKNRLEDFNYDLPKTLIAQAPVKPRDHSRLLVLGKKTGEIAHRHFYDLPDYLRKGDVLVLNNTKVMPARLIGKKAENGGKIEVFLLKKISVNSKENRIKSPLPPFVKGGRTEVWQCLVGAKRKQEGLHLEFAGGLRAELLKNNQDSTWQVKFNKSGAGFMKLIKKIGQAPLPPYINSISSEQARKKQYQTIYADEKKLGSVAAPTAGFHFTKELINRLKKKGVEFQYVTLQVGLGTFAPVKEEDITKHRMHAEWIEISKKTLENIVKAKREGRRIIAVGTTSARTLESIFGKKLKIENGKIAGWTDIFIYPGYKFKAVDAMITNFHLPKSTLLMLISAMAGREKIFKAYEEAIKKKYRFYSYGDAMLIA